MYQQYSPWCKQFAWSHYSKIGNINKQITDSHLFWLKHLQVVKGKVFLIRQSCDKAAVTCLHINQFLMEFLHRWQLENFWLDLSILERQSSTDSTHHNSTSLNSDMIFLQKYIKLTVVNSNSPSGSWCACFIKSIFEILCFSLSDHDQTTNDDCGDQT